MTEAIYETWSVGRIAHCLFAGSVDLRSAMRKMWALVKCVSGQRDKMSEAASVTEITLEESVATPGTRAPLLPIMGVVFVAFLVIGMAMPVLPLHVHNGLGFGTLAVGLVAGSQFAASLFSRPWAGHYSDTRGAKRAVVVGLVAASTSGLLYLLSLVFSSAPLTSIAILLLGRAVLGGAESFIITAAVSWGLALVDPRSTGKVIAWVGSAMFAAFAIGAPAGAALDAGYGFAAIAIATALAP